MDREQEASFHGKFVSICTGCVCLSYSCFLFSYCVSKEGFLNASTRVRMSACMCISVCAGVAMHFACVQRGTGRLILHAALRLACTAASNTAVWKRLEPEGSSSRVPGRRLAGAGPEGCAPSMEVCPARPHTLLLPSGRPPSWARPPVICQSSTQAERIPPGPWPLP